MPHAVTFHLYLGGTWFESRAGHGPSIDFPQSLQANAGAVP
jgi:hypothetical protein